MHNGQSLRNFFTPPCQLNFKHFQVPDPSPSFITFISITLPFVFASYLTTGSGGKQKHVLVPHLTEAHREQLPMYSVASVRFTLKIQIKISVCCDFNVQDKFKFQPCYLTQDSQLLLNFV